MTDYETIFTEGHETSLRGSSGSSSAFAKANSDALAAVVAAAKAEAATEAAEDFDRCLCTDEPRQDCAHHGDSTARYVGEHIVGQLRARAVTYRKGN